jgi:hypothetical protein
MAATIALLRKQLADVLSNPTGRIGATLGLVAAFAVADFAVHNRLAGALLTLLQKWVAAMWALVVAPQSIDDVVIFISWMGIPVLALCVMTLAPLEVRFAAFDPLPRFSCVCYASPFARLCSN